jgi:hypothetical protein
MGMKDDSFLYILYLLSNVKDFTSPEEWGA